jgi:hypothetical protein
MESPGSTSRVMILPDFHATTETEDEVEGRLLLDVVIRKGTTVFELLSRKDEALSIGRNALLVLDLLFYIVDGISRLDFECNRLTSQSLDEDLHCRCVILVFASGVLMGVRLFLEKYELDGNAACFRGTSV